MDRGRRNFLKFSGATLVGTFLINNLAYSFIKEELPQGKFPGQYELKEFEKLTGKKLTFKENPKILELNNKIPGNPKKLPPVEKRLPEEPLVIKPEKTEGIYGGILRGLSNATEAGTAGLLSIRHVNLVRLDTDLKTMKPFVAKGWKWNGDYTEIVFYLRKGHKWSDGKPFTAYDIEFWYNDLILNKAIYKTPPSIWTCGGKPFKVKAINSTTVKFKFPQPNPNFLLFLAVTYAQPFQPKHYYKRLLPKYNPHADRDARKLGFKNWVERLLKYYRASDWKDIPSPLLTGVDKKIIPTLELFIIIKDTPKGREYVANPYFFCVDVFGNQLPYIEGLKETYVPDKELRNLMIINGQVDIKAQSLHLEDYPLYKENEKRGKYKVYLAKSPTSIIFYSFNVNHKNPQKRKIFNNIKFRQAMSLAINREEINELIYFGQGTPAQIAGFNTDAVDFLPSWMRTYFIQYNPEKAKNLLDEVGLKDVDGDGFRELPDGSKFIIHIIYANQGTPVKLPELVKTYWEQVGIKTFIKEVTSDEYRQLANNNELDLTTWKNDKGTPVAIATTPTVALLPPFGDYFNPGTGLEWAVYLQTNGRKGEKPPEDVFKLVKLVKELMKYPFDSEEYKRIAIKIAEIHVKNLWKIGIVGNVPTPVIVSNRLRNVPKIKVFDYTYYFAYPYNTPQWFLKS